MSKLERASHNHPLVDQCLVIGDLFTSGKCQKCKRSTPFLIARNEMV